MIFNLHHGKVPEYRGGPPVFWEVHDGRDDVGYTLHKIDEGIDTGDVILSGRVPIEYRPTLSETLAATWAKLLPQSIEAIVSEVCDRFPLGSQPAPQHHRGTFRTSPRLGDVLRASKSVRDRDRGDRS
jgi:methionyl-tRNA formyltransferase